MKQYIDPKELVKVEPPPVPVVAMADPVVTDEEAVEAFKACGVLRVRPEQVKSMASLGIYLHGIGTIKTTRGSILVHQSKLEDTFQLLYDMIQDVYESKRRDKISIVMKLTKELGYLSSKLTEVQRLMVVAEEIRLAKAIKAREPLEFEEPTNVGFVPGSDVRPMMVANEIHLHQAAKPEPKSISGF